MLRFMCFTWLEASFLLLHLTNSAANKAIVFILGFDGKSVVIVSRVVVFQDELSRQRLERFLGVRSRSLRLRS